MSNGPNSSGNMFGWNQPPVPGSTAALPPAPGTTAPAPPMPPTPPVPRTPGGAPRTPGDLSYWEERREIAKGMALEAGLAINGVHRIALGMGARFAERREKVHADRAALGRAAVIAAEASTGPDKEGIRLELHNAIRRERRDAGDDPTKGIGVANSLKARVIARRVNKARYRHADAADANRSLANRSTNQHSAIRPVKGQAKRYATRRFKEMSAAGDLSDVEMRLIGQALKGGQHMSWAPEVNAFFRTINDERENTGRAMFKGTRQHQKREPRNHPRFGKHRINGSEPLTRREVLAARYARLAESGDDKKEAAEDKGIDRRMGVDDTHRKSARIKRRISRHYSDGRVVFQHIPNRRRPATAIHVPRIHGHRIHPRPR